MPCERVGWITCPSVLVVLVAHNILWNVWNQLSCETLNMLYQELTLPPCLSNQLIWSCFVNTHGIPGRNIAGNLYMEHLTQTAKGAIKSLGANKTERAIGQVDKVIWTFPPLLQSFDVKNKVKEVCGAHKRANVMKENSIVVNLWQTASKLQFT